MIKDLVVNLSVGERPGFAGEYAVSVAAAFAAHVAGVAFVYDPILPVSDAGYIPPELIETQQADNEAAAKAAIGRFTSAAAHAALAAEWLTLRSGVAAAADQFGRIARRYDLAIVGQADPEISAVEESIAQTTLFESGRPMIVVPFIQKAPLKLNRIMLCWDGSRPAARAIADAMPLLERAGGVEIVIVASAPEKDDEIAGADMGQHLARHGLKVEVERLSGVGIDVG